MSLWWLFLTSFYIGFSGAVMPGPMFVATVHGGVRRGWRTGAAVTGGHFVVEGTLVLLLVWGAARWIQTDAVRATVALLGGLVLVGLGVDAWRGARSSADRVAELTDHPEAAEAARLPARDGLAGAVTSLVNPYFYIWWGTIGLGLIVKGQALGAAGVPVMYAGHILSDAVWFVLVGALAGQSRRHLRPGGLTVLYRICGGAMILLGGRFLAEGWALVRAAGGAG